MLADYESMPNYGTITQNIIPHSSILAILDFVEGHLTEFASKCNNVLAEDSLTYKLVDLLEYYNHQRPSLFRFIREDIQNIKNGTSPRVDIGVKSNDPNGIGIIIDAKTYSIEESFFSIEAKRLKTSKIREKEYLIGRYEKDKYLDCGGVERFKKGIHGRSLKYSCILGYVQEYDFKHWHIIINSWIDELIKENDSEVKWLEEDKLAEEYSKDTVAKYKSENRRVNNCSIILYHLWVNLCKNASIGLIKEI